VQLGLRAGKKTRCGRERGTGSAPQKLNRVWGAFLLLRRVAHGLSGAKIRREQPTSASLRRPTHCGRVAEWRSLHANWLMSVCYHCRLRLLTKAGRLHAAPLFPFPAWTAQALSVSEPRKRPSCKHPGNSQKIGATSPIVDSCPKPARKLSSFKQFFSAANLRVSRILRLDPTWRSVLYRPCFLFATLLPSKGARHRNRDC
jgi:hypothetical protein